MFLNGDRLLKALQTNMLASLAQLVKIIIAIDKITVYIFSEKWILLGIYENTIAIQLPKVVTFYQIISQRVLCTLKINNSFKTFLLKSDLLQSNYKHKVIIVQSQHLLTMDIYQSGSIPGEKIDCFLTLAVHSGHQFNFKNKHKTTTPSQGPILISMLVILRSAY